MTCPHCNLLREALTESDKIKDYLKNKSLNLKDPTSITTSGYYVGIDMSSAKCKLYHFHKDHAAPWVCCEDKEVLASFLPLHVKVVGPISLMTEC